MYKIDDIQVITELQNFELDTLRDTGVQNISGGYAIADIFNYDNDYFDIELRWGVQSDCESRTHVEYYKMDRETLKIYDA